MKQVFVGFAVLLLLNAVQSLDFTNEMNDCGHEMGISPDEIKDMVANNDEKLGCINACVMKNLGVLVDGKIHKDVALGVIEKNKDAISNPSQATEGLDACISEATSGGDLPECQLARKFAICMHKLAEG